MAGELAAGRNEPGVAARQFLAALQYLDDPDLARRATGLALGADDADLLLAAARRWHELAPNAADPREVIASVLLQRGEIAGTLEQCRAIISGHPGGLGDGFRNVAHLLSQTGSDQADLSLLIMRKLVNEWPDEAGAHHALGVLAIRFGRLDLAEAAAERAIELAPDDREHAMLQVGVWLRAGRLEDANRRVDELTRGSGDAATLRMAYARMLLDAGRRAEAQQAFEAVLKLHRNDPDAHYALGVLQASTGNYRSAKSHFKVLLKGPRSQDAAMQLGRIAEAEHEYERALDYYGRVVHGPGAIDAATRRAAVLADLGKIDEARALLQQLGQRLPQFGLRFLLAEGELLVEHNRYDEALQLYDDALMDQPDEPDLLYGRSLVHERLDRIDQAEDDLRAILGMAPDDARALNALGYMLTVHTDRYDEAAGLIGRALGLEPEDPAIQDSMGWLEFKRGNPDAALEWLNRAYARFPDPEVAAHLGEVLWSLGRRDDAGEIWRNALKLHPDHPLLTETMERFAQ